MVNMTNDEHQRLCDLAKRAEAAEARAAELQAECNAWMERARIAEGDLSKLALNNSTITQERDELRAALRLLTT